MKVLAWLSLVLASCETKPVYAQSTVSQIALVAAQGADTGTTLSCNCYESNPMGLRATLLNKAVLTPALLIGEHYAAREHPRMRKWFTVLNFGLSAEFGWAAWHNARLR